MKEQIWNYDSVGLFFNKYYEKLLTENMVSGGEMFIEEYKDEFGTPQPLERGFLFPLKKDKLTYLIPTEYVNKLPIMVTKFVRASYSGKGYRLVTKLKPMKITPEKTFSFRELVNNFMDTKHTNPKHDLLWRLISIVAYVDRINVRVATNPEFGKDSKLNIINSLTGEIGKVSNPTIAKLEYMLFNKVCFINEVAGINSQSKQDVEQFILQCGDFNNDYTKRSRAGAGSNEKYDISRMSLVIAYNDLGQYTNSSKYFDFLWTNTGAINNRIFPLLFNGKIEADFNQPFNTEEVVGENWEFYIKFMRALLYYKGNNVTSIKYDIPKFTFTSDRWERNFNIIAKWVSEYSETQEEFTELMTDLYKAHVSYLKMVGHNDNSISEESDQPLTLIEESMVNADEKRVIEYLEKYDKGEGLDIDVILNGCLVKEDVINKLKSKGDLFEAKSGRVRLLK